MHIQLKPRTPTMRATNLATVHRFTTLNPRNVSPGQVCIKHPLNSLSRRAEESSQGSQASAVQNVTERTTLRLGLPSKGRMAEDTLSLLKDCQLSVYKPNPRQYVARIPQLPGLEIWFQRASDVVRKLKYGDVDLGIVGFDMFSELAGDGQDLVVVHDGLDFGHCHLSLGIPSSGEYVQVNSADELINMKTSEGQRWTASNPMRIVTGYPSILKDFFKRKGFEDYTILGGDGALEAAPAMGSADIIFDLVSTGVTLRENNLKEIEGGQVLQSEGVLVANREALLNKPKLLQFSKELIERFDAHLKAQQYFSVVTNIWATSPEDAAQRLLNVDYLSGLEGPTISPVFVRSTSNGSVKAERGLYAAVICVEKKNLYNAVKELRAVGGCGTFIQPMTYIFDEESMRWTALAQKLGIDPGSIT